jgi:PAS domain-containing protein
VIESNEADQVATIEADTASMVLNAIQHPVIMVDANSVVCFANWEAESFFAASAAHLGRHKLDAFIPFGSPLLELIEQVRERRAAVNEYRVDLSSPRLGSDKLVDLYVAPVAGLPAIFPGALDGRQVRPADDPSRRGAVGHRTGLHAGHESRTRCPASAARRSCSSRRSATRTAP